MKRITSVVLAVVLMLSLLSTVAFTSFAEQKRETVVAFDSGYLDYMKNEGWYNDKDWDQFTKSTIAFADEGFKLSSAKDINYNFEFFSQYNVNLKNIPTVNETTYIDVKNNTEQAAKLKIKVGGYTTPEDSALPLIGVGETATIEFPVLTGGKMAILLANTAGTFPVGKDQFEVSSIYKYESEEPTEAPTTEEPTEAPTDAPTEESTEAPTEEPTEVETTTAKPTTKEVLFTEEAIDYAKTEGWYDASWWGTGTKSKFEFDSLGGFKISTSKDINNEKIDFYQQVVIKFKGLTATGKESYVDIKNNYETPVKIKIIANGHKTVADADLPILASNTKATYKVDSFEGGDFQVQIHNTTGKILLGNDQFEVSSLYTEKSVNDVSLTEDKLSWQKTEGWYENKYWITGTKSSIVFDSFGGFVFSTAKDINTNYDFYSQITANFKDLAPTRKETYVDITNNTEKAIKVKLIAKGHTTIADANLPILAAKSKGTFKLDSFLGGNLQVMLANTDGKMLLGKDQYTVSNLYTVPAVDEVKFSEAKMAWQKTEGWYENKYWITGTKSSVVFDEEKGSFVISTAKDINTNYDFHNQMTVNFSNLPGTRKESYIDVKNNTEKAIKVKFIGKGFATVADANLPILAANSKATFTLESYLGGGLQIMLANTDGKMPLGKDQYEISSLYTVKKEEPTTEVPTTEAPTTEAPTSEVPTTSGSENEECDHSNTYVYKIAPTYFSAGQTMVICRDCGEVVKITSVPALTLKTTAKVTAKAGKKIANVSWKKVKDAKGYQVQMKKGSGKWVAVKKTTKLSLKVRKLSSRSKYKFRVRAYTTKGRMTTVSSYKTSKVIKIK